MATGNKSRRNPGGDFTCPADSRSVLLNEELHAFQIQSLCCYENGKKMTRDLTGIVVLFQIPQRHCIIAIHGLTQVARRCVLVQFVIIHTQDVVNKWPTITRQCVNQREHIYSSSVSTRVHPMPLRLPLSLLTNRFTRNIIIIIISRSLVDWSTIVIVPEP